MSAEKATKSEKIARGLAHSKLILIGEHSVVHGQPAIALPFPLVGVEATIENVPGSIQLDSTFYHGPITSVPDSLKGITNSVFATLEYLDIPAKDLLIQVQSSIPPGKGLGSSASVAIALVRSLFAYANKEFTEGELLQLANIAETYNHGEPSGIDTLTITAKSPVWFEKDKPVSFITPGDDFHFVVADSGRVGDTRLAVESVANLLKSGPQKFQKKLERIGELTHHAKYALEKAGKQILGQLLNEAQKELESFGVSDASLNRLIYFARQEGALGAKLTGAGNGGCIIALAQNEVHSRQLADKLKQFGAQAVWPFVLTKDDVQ